MDGKISKKEDRDHRHQEGVHTENGTKLNQVLLTVKPSQTGYGSFSNDGESDISSVTSIDELDHIPEDCLNNKILMGTVYAKDRANQDRFVPGIPVRARINEVFRTPRSHVLNPNLYTIELQHGNYKWSIQRRHRQFLRLHTELILLKAASQLPTTKREKIKSKLPSFPKRPEISVISEQNLERRKKAFEKYIQQILNMEEIRSEREVLDFVEVSMVSFVHDCGQKNKETMINKRAGGQRAGLGFCGALKCSCCGLWNKRWMSLKDSYVLYMNPKTLVIRDVLLIDSKFTVKSGKKQSGLRNGLVISNDERDLTFKCESRRDTREWVTAVAKTMASSGADWLKEHHHESFAPLRRESQVQWFVDSSGYLAAVADAIEKAEEEIFITDWWLSPEIHLKRPVKDLGRWRLDQLLQERAQNGVRIYIMLYKEIEMALSINSLYSKQVLHGLHHSNIKVLRHPDHLPGSGTFLWAHHEKIVCIDQKIAFLGGVDLCYGRWDNRHHKLTDFGSARPTFLTRTGSTIANISKLFVEAVPILPNSSSVEEFGTSTSIDCEDATAGEAKYFIGKDFCNPYRKDVIELDKPLEDSVDRNLFPRMPWHDIAAVVYGPAARDVGRHFIQRWNFTKKEKLKEFESYPLLLPRTYNPMPEVMPYDIENTSIADCQILRSASRWSAGISTESSIHKAYIETIKNSKHFIYIENQFFITSLKSESVYNEIGDALVERIAKAHRNGENFKVIVVMPLLPCFPGEIGQPSGAAMLAVEHWNYRTICRSPESILELLKALGVKHPSKYIRIYGLRNYEDLRGKLVTEIIYVHSKLMIVDDRIVILGSANINDRSMLGSRDSEIGIFVQDTQLVDSKMNNKPYKAGRFAKSMRKHIFKEHLGLFDDSEHDIEDPLSSKLHEFIINTARNNTEIYEELFGCLPSDQVKSFAELPAYNKRDRLALKDQLAARAKLKSIQGYLVEKPLQFLGNQDMTPATGTAEGLVPTSVFT